MRDSPEDDAAISNLIGLYVDSQFDYRSFKYDLADWGGSVLQKLSESPVNRVEAYKLDDLAPGNRGRDELEDFFEDLIEAGVASKIDKRDPVYDLSPITSQKPLSMGYELFLEKVDEAERIVSRMERKHGQSEIEDFVEGN